MTGSLFALLIGVTAAADIPQQFHIAIAGSDGMRVGWKTNNDTAATICSYGPSPTSMPSTASGTRKQYMPGHGFHHVARLGPLTPSTTYFYSCGDGTAANSNSPISFTTPQPPTSTGTVRMAIFGDWGYEDSILRPMDVPFGGLALNWSATFTRELLETLKNTGQIDSVWHVGDIGYMDDSFGHVGELLHFGYEPAYDGFMSWIQNLSSTMPYMVSVGNHESECHSPYCLLDLAGTGLHLNNFSAYNTRWAMPGPESGGVDGMWYSWRIGGVHFVSINTETDFPGAEEEDTGDGHFEQLPAGHFGADGQYMAWLASDLAAAAADSTVHWIIAGGHRPFEDFASSSVLALFKQYGVAMYFAGHGHSYTRYDAGAYGDGTVHVMVGGAGCDEMAFPSDQVQDGAPHNGSAACEAWCSRTEVRASFAHSSTEKSTEVAPEIDPCRYCAKDPVYASDKYAIGTLQASPTALQWDLLWAPSGQVLDTITITRN